MDQGELGKYLEADGGGEVEEVDESGYTALHLAAMWCDAETVTR